MAHLGSFRALAVLLASFTSHASAGSFLEARPSHTEKTVSRGSVQQAFASAMHMEVGALRDFEDELRPMYASLPKTSRGALEPSVVRYALYRYFVHKHGWYMKGMQPTSDMSAAQSAAGIQKDQVPAYVQGLLEEHMESQEWGLHELAVCAAALSELIQGEVMADLLFVYSSVLQYSTTSLLNDYQYGLVVDMYLAQYLLAETWTDWRQQQMLYEARDSYDGWTDLSLWAGDLRRSFEFMNADRGNPFVKSGVSFERVAGFIQELMHRYTSFQSVECGALTEALLDLEHKGTGRVPLGDFYRTGLVGKWKFWEPKEYLRHVGALDESDPLRPAVIIPNYVYGMNNCLASSSFFSVCCANKCERLVGHVESAIAAPSAPPGRLAEVVAGLPSDTVDAPRNLSSPLLSRLSEMADLHGGEVPLHSRLFSQWMHHAYPRECPYPHADLPESMLTPEEWKAETGAEYLLLTSELRTQAKEHSQHGPSGNEELPWSAAEELIGRHQARGRHSIWRKGMAFLAVASFALPVMRGWSAFLGTAEPKRLEKQMV